MGGVIGISVIAFLWWYFIMWNRRQDEERRAAIVDYLKRLPRYEYGERSKLVGELIKLDLQLAGGCKKKWGFITCGNCNVRRCPVNANREFYAQFDTRPIPPRPSRD